MRLCGVGVPCQAQGGEGGEVVGGVGGGEPELAGREISYAVMR